MISGRQLRANQLNAQQSTGPRTLEGKRRASVNANTHGLTAKDFAVTPEEGPELEEIADAYTDHFRPKDPIEAHLVEELVMAKMRQKRAWRLEAAEITLEVGRQLEKVATDFPSATNVERVALAVEWLADNGRTLEYLRRYDGQFRRAWHHCLEKLEARKRNSQNEPIPINEHSGPPHAQEPEEARTERQIQHHASARRTRPPGRSLPRGARGISPKDADPPHEG